MDNEEARDQKTDVKEKISEVKERVVETAEKGKEKARELYENVKEKLSTQDWKKVKESTREYIRNNPEKAVIASLAVGFFVGYLIKRRHD